MSRVGSWICCHLGAREHYAVPLALHRQQRLSTLITDAWAPPGSGWTRLPGDLGRRLGERYLPELADAAVRDFTGSLVVHEMGWRARQLEGWPLLVARNRWFQDRAAQAVRDLKTAPGPQAVFAHSYAALAPFQAAKARGWTTVLGQIDPGEEHVAVVARESARWPEYGAAPPPPPQEYFAAWRQECALADHIVVNSEWAREGVVRAGVPAGKLSVVPLPYEPDGAGAAWPREYPERFTAERPLRALIAGSVATAKGVPALLEAMERLRDRPITLTVVGPLAMTVPARFREHPAIRWVGPVQRSEVMRHCREADVLVFPSASDGFGMVQVEAQGWKLPVIASRFCGQVVRDGVNGLLLPEVSTDAIEQALRTVEQRPALLAAFAARSQPDAGASVTALGAALERLGPA